jgi:hypothetical protein
MNRHNPHRASRIALEAAAMLALCTFFAGCPQTIVTVLTQAPPGRSAFVDDGETRTLTLTRGVAVALECTARSDAWSGPCRDLSATLDDEDLATVLPVHLDALPGQTVPLAGGDDTTVVTPHDRAGFVLLATDAGSGELTVTTPDGPPVTLAVVVEDPPDPDGE